ncbi:Sugar transport protein 8 [Camellia lanceoleosa]|uniref:Sugar transport protein 8 n=1 Tax=Camellia lanceoleosa TaxID=1840588 RepID=A0ACC0GWC3_9ERIC|nr:Sugar transport protein 8 [Camellia lanceoleosa]
MDDFLIKFFPKVHERKLHAKEDNYCKYDNQLLQLFTSSLYLAALIASFGASKACRIFGRKPTILVASLFFIGGAGFSALAEHKWMLILGRILFGIGVGFGNENLRLCFRCQLQHVDDFPGGLSFLIDVLSHASLHILFLLGLDFGHGIVCGVPRARNKGRSDLFHCGKGVEAASGVEKVRG